MCSLIDIEATSADLHKYVDITSEEYKIIIEDFKNKYNEIKTNKDLLKYRLYLQNKYKIIISNSHFIKIYNFLDLKEPSLKLLLTKKKSKSNSGVIVITVLTSAHPEYIDEDGNNKKAAFSCKHDCHYCPNEKASKDNNWVDQPRSYLFSEPAVLRANDNDFDAIKQMNARLKNLINMGHKVDKLEIIVLGGTWSEYPRHYQDRFIKELYYAANTYYDIDKRQQMSLEKEITINENSKIHIIGLTLETRPDTITLEEIENFRRYNCTRVQLGVQHTDNYVLKKINRGHNIECVYEAIKLLKNNCYKVDIHIMPNLPFSSYEKDKKMLDDILYDDRIQVDQIKIYPCAVVPFTKIKEWFDEGKYVPYDDMLLFELIKDFKINIQTYKRLNRIIRDIPSIYITGGYRHKFVNMRQLLQDDMKREKWKCNCIRCREVGDKKVNENDIKFVKKYYRSSDGDEYFLSFETEDYLIGFIRLRINYNQDNILLVLKNAALIRELHVYSNLSCVGDTNNMSMQHKGYGKRLIEEAEKISIQNNIYKVAIISGTGVRNYYKKYGYELKETYMIKNLYKKKDVSCCIQ